MPNPIATITGEQRDALYEHIVDRLTFFPDLQLCLQRGDVAIAGRLSREFRQDLRLLDDLGLGEDERSQVPLTMPADELAETLSRLRADARGGLTESPEDRCNRELEEADRRRYRLIEAAAADILAELAAQDRSPLRREPGPLPGVVGDRRAKRPGAGQPRTSRRESRAGRDLGRLPMTAGSRSKTPFPFKALARFADNLYRARELAGLDQKEAAKRAALTRAKLDKIEGGEYIPSLDILIRLAGTYSTTVGDLVNGVTWNPGWVEHSGPAEYLVSEDKPRATT